MRRSDWLRALAGVVLWFAYVFAILFLSSCTRTFVPSGRPGCPNATVWSDSAQRCIAREGR